MSIKSTILLLTGSLFVAGTASAQVTFLLGPQVGGQAATASYSDQGFFLGDDSHTWGTGYLGGFEAGLVGSFAAGHWALQPAVLFSQKGFRLTNQFIDTSDPSRSISYEVEQKYQLSYLTLPLNVAYSFHANGQGLQLFGGPYAGWLLGGRYSSDVRSFDSAAGTPLLTHRAGDVMGSGPERTISRTDELTHNFYSRRLDAGFQAGLGYQAGKWLVRASYVRGLRDMGVRYFGTNNHGGGAAPVATYSHYNQALQLSVAYLFHVKG